MADTIDRKPLVSCIIIFFNAGEKFFIEAIESILAQTYENWELLLADDGSTDGSTAIALRYAQQYPHKVRYVEHEAHQNRGMSATRNLGIRHAKGEYVAFLDADDVWLPHKLQQQVPILESHKEAAMLYGKTQFWFTWTENNPVSWHREQSDLMTITSVQFDALIKPPTQLLLFLKDKNIYPCTCSILIRRRVFEEIGGFEEDFRDAHEDMVFHSKVFLKAPVYVSSQCWDKYRIHQDSYWRNVDRQGKGEETRRIGRLKYLTWLKAYLLEKEIKDPEVWKEIEKELWTYGNPIRYRLIKHIKQLPLQSFSLGMQIVRKILPKSVYLQVENFIRLIILQNSVKPISNLSKINYATTDLIVLCVVRNAESSLGKFIEHCFSLGAKHIVFLDNESIDGTLTVASNYENVTILQSKYKSPNYRNIMKEYLIKRFAQNQAYIFLEINELLN